MAVPWVVQQKEIKKQIVESKKIYFSLKLRFYKKYSYRLHQLAETRKT